MRPAASGPTTHITDTTKEKSMETKSYPQTEKQFQEEKMTVWQELLLLLLDNPQHHRRVATCVLANILDADGLDNNLLVQAIHKARKELSQ
jgi:hypothetical protein